jgi:two-component system phosphate regulon sensor histidine kinase PhoR
MPRTLLAKILTGYFLTVLCVALVLELHVRGVVPAGGAVLLDALVIGFLLWWTLRAVMSPLEEITEVAQAMSRGELQREIPIYSRDEIGRLAGAINHMAQRLSHTIREITEEKNRAQAILNSMADGVIAVDRAGRVLLVNPVVEKVFGITQAESRGKSVIGVIRNFELERLLQQALATREQVMRELVILTPEPRVFRVHITPLRGTDEGPGGVVALLRDITERRRLEQMRTEFVANVSHELRTPLTSIRGFLETLLDGAVEDPLTARRFLEIMVMETNRLTRLIDDLLQLSRLEDRRTVLRHERVDMATVVGRVVDIFQTRAQEKGVELGVEVEAHLPPVSGDPDMLAQVLVNLVDNAVKYTPEGGRITIRAGVVGGRLRVSVADTGVGIPEESLSRVFERFYRVDKARAREQGGTGLGLAIVKHIVEAHGGRVWAQSEVGRGSTFTFELPVG